MRLEEIDLCEGEDEMPSMFRFKLIDTTDYDYSLTLSELGTRDRDRDDVKFC